MPALQSPPPESDVRPNSHHHRRAQRKTWREKMTSLSRTTKLVLFMFFTLNFFIFLAFAVLGKARINAFFNDTGNKLRKMGYLGVLIPGSAVVATSHPPLFGFTFGMMLIGYAWGLWPGLLFGAIASQVGGWFAWVSIRTFFLRWMRAEGSRQNRHWEAFAHVIRERGVLLVVMIRWCPLPYAFGNGVFAAIDGVKFWQYALANLSFTPRLLIPVFIGSRLRSLGNDTPDPTRWWINLLSIGVALGCGVITGWVIYRRVLVQLREFDRGEGLDPGNSGHHGHHDGDIAAEALESGRLLGAYDEADEETDDVVSGEDEPQEGVLVPVEQV